MTRQNDQNMNLLKLVFSCIQQVSVSEQKRERERELILLPSLLPFSPSLSRSLFRLLLRIGLLLWKQQQQQWKPEPAAAGSAAVPRRRTAATARRSELSFVSPLPSLLLLELTISPTSFLSSLLKAWGNQQQQHSVRPPTLSSPSLPLSQLSPLSNPSLSSPPPPPSLSLSTSPPSPPVVLPTPTKSTSTSPATLQAFRRKPSGSIRPGDRSLSRWRARRQHGEPVERKVHGDAG